MPFSFVERKNLMNASTEQTNTLENEELKRIISDNTIITHYQPIISVSKNKIIGIESLARGVDNITGHLISPIILFAYAHANSMILQLDRLCREKGIEGFKNINNFISKELYDSTAETLRIISIMQVFTIIMSNYIAYRIYQEI